jgi:hypothetical protein
MTATVGRGTGAHGGLDSGDDALDRFQKREREVAGAAMGGGELWPTRLHSICCESDEEKRSGRSSGGKQRGYERQRDARLTVGDEFRR